jgi:hypothetical protein
MISINNKNHIKMLTDSQINIFFSEINNSINVIGDTWNFENVIYNMSKKYDNFEEILNTQIKTNEQFKNLINEINQTNIEKVDNKLRIKLNMSLLLIST